MLQGIPLGRPCLNDLVPDSDLVCALSGRVKPLC